MPSGPGGRCGKGQRQRAQVRVAGEQGQGAALGGGDPAQGEQVAPDEDQPEQGAAGLGAAAVSGRLLIDGLLPQLVEDVVVGVQGVLQEVVQEGRHAPGGETVLLPGGALRLRGAPVDQGQRVLVEGEQEALAEEERRAGPGASCPPAPARPEPAGARAAGRPGRGPGWAHRGGGWCGRRRGAAGGGGRRWRLRRRTPAAHAARGPAPRPSSSGAEGLSASSQTEARPARQAARAAGTSPPPGPPGAVPGGPRGDSGTALVRAPSSAHAVGAAL